MPRLLRQSLGLGQNGDQHRIGMLREPDQMLPARPAFAGQPILGRPLTRSGPAHHRLDGLMRRSQFAAQGIGNGLAIGGLIGVQVC